MNTFSRQFQLENPARRRNSDGTEVLWGFRCFGDWGRLAASYKHAASSAATGIGAVAVATQSMFWINVDRIRRAER